ncbi:hypothetical protein ADL26_15410, partial [Thermoactinomyces vulgaris]
VGRVEQVLPDEFPDQGDEFAMAVDGVAGVSHFDVLFTEAQVSGFGVARAGSFVVRPVGRRRLEGGQCPEDCSALGRCAVHERLPHAFGLGALDRDGAAVCEPVPEHERDRRRDEHRCRDREQL